MSDFLVMEPLDSANYLLGHAGCSFLIKVTLLNFIEKLTAVAQLSHYIDNVTVFEDLVKSQYVRVTAQIAQAPEGVDLFLDIVTFG